MTGQSNMSGGTAGLFQPQADVARPPGDERPERPADDERPAQPAPANSTDVPDDSVPLLKPDETALYQSRWEECLRGFVDEPRGSVQQADELVADVIRELANEFAGERGRLEEQWGRGDEVSTEELRIALQRYRSFFNRLLRV